VSRWAIDWAGVNRSSSPCISAGRGLNSGGAGRGSSISRVALLYLRGQRWSCRKCCDLAYQSELESKGYRGQMKARKIRVRLGGNRSGIEFPDKPTRMHWRTYERWREKHDAAVAKSWSGFWGSRFARRLGLG
jgi:hypothetical protein